MSEHDLPEFEFSDELMDELNAHAEAQKGDAGAEGAQGAVDAGSSADVPGSSTDAAAGASQQSAEGTEFFAWQVCHADMETQSLMNADDYADYIVNRETITQMLGIGMASGQNAFPLNDHMFVVAVSRQENGGISLIGPDFPRYQEMSALISEKLLSGEDHGMLAQLPNGNLIAIKQPM